MLHCNPGQVKEQDKCLNTEGGGKTNDEGSKKHASTNTTAKVQTKHLLHDTRQGPPKGGAALGDEPIRFPCKTLQPLRADLYCLLLWYQPIQRARTTLYMEIWPLPAPQMITYLPLAAAAIQHSSAEQKSSPLLPSSKTGTMVSTRHLFRWIHLTCLWLPRLLLLPMKRQAVLFYTATRIR